MSLDNQLFFSADGGIKGNELWVTDGTVDGTQLFKDINQYRLTSPPAELTANDDQLIIFAGENINLTADLLKNDNGDKLDIIKVGKPSNGIVSLDSNGNIFFTVGEDFSGDASFTYTIGERNGVTDSAIVKLTIQQSDFSSENLLEDKSIFGVGNNIFSEEMGINFAVGQDNQLMGVQENILSFSQT